MMNEKRFAPEGHVLHRFAFSASAIRHASVVNYTSGSDVALSLYIRARGAQRSAVLNSRFEGAWGQELSLPLPEGSEAEVSLQFRGGRITVEVPGQEPVPFAGAQPFPPSAKLSFPASIALEEIAPVAQAAPPPAALPPPQGYIDFQGALDGTGLWLCGGWTGDMAAERLFEGALPLRLVFAQGSLAGRAHVCWYERADLGGAGTGLLLLGTLAGDGPSLGDFDHAELTRPDGSLLVLRASEPAARHAPATLMQWAEGLMARGRGAGLAPMRAAAGRVYGGVETIGRLPIHFEIDEVCLVEGDGAFVVGWLVDPGEKIASIRLCSRAGASQNLFERWLGMERPDVRASFEGRYDLAGRRLGFLAYAELPGLLPGEAWLEVVMADGEVGFKTLPAPRLSGLGAIRRLLSLAAIPFDELDRVFGTILARPLVLLNRRRLARPMAVSELAFGAPPAAPRCSLVVPLYGRMDFLTYQTALLSAAWSGQDELIYVLDEPEKKQALFDLAHSAHERFRLPFRLVFPAENRGFGPASNLGLRRAKGEFVCFLNSDVFPQEGAWLDHLLADLRADASIGIAGGLLLFADGSVQHAGMAYEPVRQFADWLFPIHPGKGFRPGPAEGAPREVQAVTGACMVMRRALAETLGGFDEDFVLGDFEDADLCERVKAEGLRCVVDDRARLYHLERQSQGEQAAIWRMNLTLLNAWTWGRRWDRRSTG